MTHHSDHWRLFHWGGIKISKRSFAHQVSLRAMHVLRFPSKFRNNKCNGVEIKVHIHSGLNTFGHQLFHQLRRLHPNRHCKFIQGHLSLDFHDSFMSCWSGDLSFPCLTTHGGLFLFRLKNNFAFSKFCRRELNFFAFFGSCSTGFFTFFFFGALFKFFIKSWSFKYWNSRL